MEKTNGKKWNVLVAEPLGKEGVDILSAAADVQLFEETSLTREELLARLPEMDAVLTRSATKIDAEALDCTGRLKVVGRAGVGVDNVDLTEASRRGVVVINAPTGNTLAAAEHTMALMLSLVRKVPQAHQSILEGKWDRKKFVGRQLSGKRLLIIGLGRIGLQVAIRCRSFGMEVVAYDPFMSPKKAESLGITLVTDLQGSAAMADVITLHLPITSETRNLFDEKMLRAVKPGAFIINCARGGVVNEIACAEAVREGRLAGVAFDVFTKEPLSADHPLLANDIADRVVLTPHLGASTEEAQTEVARIAVTNVLAALRGEPYEHAVNLPFMEQQLNASQKSFLSLARKMGILAAKLATVTGDGIHECKIMLRGPLLADEEDIPAPNRKRSYTIAFLKGLLEVSHGADVNYMIAPLLAEEKGISIEESTGESKTYKNLIEISAKTDKGIIQLKGSVTEEGRHRIVQVNDYWIDFVPKGNLLIFQNHDRPGVIGKVGKLLGDAQVNIANFALGRKEESGLALAIIQVDNDISEELCETLAKDADMIWATSVELDRES